MAGFNWNSAKNDSTKGAVLGGSHGAFMGAVMGGTGQGNKALSGLKGIKSGGMSDKARKTFEKLAGLNDDDIATPFSVSNNFGKGPQDSAFRTDQTSFIKALQAQAAGQGPSLAQAMANQQRQAGVNQMMAQNASVRGQNPALMARSMNMNTNNLNQQIAQQALMARMQEQLNAQGQLGGALTNFRGQDQAFQGQKLDFNKALGNARTQAELQEQNLNAQGDLQSRKLRAEQLSKTRDFFQNFGTSMGGGFAGAGAMG